MPLMRRIRNPRTASASSGVLSRCYVETMPTGRSCAIFARCCRLRPRREPESARGERPGRRAGDAGKRPAGTLSAIVDEFIKLLDALTRLVGAIVLPVAVFAVFWIFRMDVSRVSARTTGPRSDVAAEEDRGTPS